MDTGIIIIIIAIASLFLIFVNAMIYAELQREINVNRDIMMKIYKAQKERNKIK
jgi:hypothetical protein